MSASSRSTWALEAYEAALTPSREAREELKAFVRRT
jgi:hypothetical protein